MSVVGRLSPLLASSIPGSPVALDGRLPPQPGTTVNSYIRIPERSITDPTQKYSLFAWTTGTYCSRTFRCKQLSAVIDLLFLFALYLLNIFISPRVWKFRTVTLWILVQLSILHHQMQENVSSKTRGIPYIQRHCILPISLISLQQEQVGSGL